MCQKVVAAVLQVLNPAEKAVLPTNSPAGGNQPEITAQPESKSETPVTHLEQLGEIPSATGVVVITQTMEILQIEVKPQTGLPEPTPGKRICSSWGWKYQRSMKFRKLLERECS